MRGYLAVMRGNFMVGIVYRFGFLFNILGNIIYLGVAYYLWKSIYEYADTIRGLTFNETFLYVGLGSAIFILLKTYVDWIMNFEIREGAIANYLIKPIDFGLYTLFATFGGLLVNLVAITIPTLIMLIVVFKVKFATGPGLVVFPLSLFMAFLVSFYIDYFVGLLGFYSESVWGLSTVKEIIVTVFSGALIPLQFFPDTLQKVLLWLPFQAIYHTPLMMVTRPDQSLDVFLTMLFVQFLWVVILFIGTRLFYNQAIKVLQIAEANMRSISEYLRLYFIIEAQYIKARMQYRADFIISSIGMFFSSLATLGVFWVILQSVPDLAGWSLMEMVFIYAFYMIAISPMQILFDHAWQLRFHIQQGTFLKYYFRPLNMMFYYMSEMFDIKGLTQLVMGIILLVYASNQLHIDWTPIRIALLFVTLFGAALVQISIIVMAACASFWVVNSYPVLGLAWKLREFSPYPMSIFDGAFRFAFTFIIPIGFVAFYPSQLFLRPQDVSSLVYLSPVIGMGLFMLTYWVWTKGVNSYTGTGS